MNCTVCNNIINDATSIDIYYTFATHTHNLLVNNIKKILNCDLNEPHSKYICKECYSIFEELDLTEFTFARIKRQIFDRWILTDFDSFTKDVSCQTDCQFPTDTSCQTDDLFGSDTADTKDFSVLSDTVLLDAIKKEEFTFDNEPETCTEKRNTTRNKTRDKENKSYQCSTCPKRFASKNGLNLHIQRQHPNEESSSNDNDITDNSINVDCNVEIDECSKTEPDSNLDSQINDDSSNNSSKSPTVTTKKRVKKEFSNSVKPLKYSCPQCPKMWRTMGELKNHIASHSNLRPYICEVCGQAYKHKPALDIHVGMHSGINPFSCNYCHKAFTQKGALQRHLPIHTGEAPYQCDLCGKRFVHHTSFNMHTLAHTGQKSYKCSVCGLALLSGSHLKRHMRVHTGERPYACTQCGKRFAERYNLVAHQRLHEAGPSELSKRLYRCQVCGAGFDRRPKLEEHLSNNHNKISENDPSRKWLYVLSCLYRRGNPAMIYILIVLVIFVNYCMYCNYAMLFIKS